MAPGSVWRADFAAPGAACDRWPCGTAGRPCGKQRLSPIARQSQAAPGQTIRKAAPFQQQPNHSGYAEVGHHAAGTPSTARATEA